MNLADTLLPKLTDWQPVGEGRHSASIALPESGWTVQATAEQVDKIGGKWTELRATRSAPASTDGEGFAKHVRSAAGRVSGLLEPLRTIEIEKSEQVAILRSDVPASQGDRVSYYEARLKGLGEVSVQRYQASRSGGEPREAVPFTLTHEVTAKLIDDLTRSS